MGLFIIGEKHNDPSGLDIAKARLDKGIPLLLEGMWRNLKAEFQPKAWVEFEAFVRIRIKELPALDVDKKVERIMKGEEEPSKEEKAWLKNLMERRKLMEEYPELVQTIEAPTTLLLMKLLNAYLEAKKTIEEIKAIIELNKELLNRLRGENWEAAGAMEKLNETFVWFLEALERDREKREEIAKEIAKYPIGGIGLVMDKLGLEGRGEVGKAYLRFVGMPRTRFFISQIKEAGRVWENITVIVGEGHKKQMEESGFI